MLRNGYEMLVVFMLINYDGLNLKKNVLLYIFGHSFWKFDKNKCSEHESFLFNYLFNLKEINWQF
jgi:hypothetical protein